MESLVSATMAEQVLQCLFELINDADALLGEKNLRDRALEATRLSTLPLGASTLFLEIPLAGVPSFDLHVYPEIAHEKMRCIEKERALFARWPQYEGLIGYCAKRPAGVAEAGYAFDLSSNAEALDHPCIYTAFFDKDRSAIIPSVGLMGGPQFEPSLRRIKDSLPRRTLVYYTGVMHGREPVVAHIGFKVGPLLAREYAGNPDQLVRDLRKLGFSFQEFNLEEFGMLSRFGFIRDIQFAFDENGVIDESLALSFVGREKGLKRNTESFHAGEQREVLELLQRRGLADGRWRLLDSVVGGRRMCVYAQGELREAAVAITVGYVKVRWMSGGLRSPSKMYLSVKSVALDKKGE